MPINRFDDGTAFIDDAGEKAILIGFFPWPEEEDEDAWVRHFAAVAYSYEANCHVVWTPDQVFDLPKGVPVVAIEEYGGNERGVVLDAFEHPEKAIYIVGNSHFRFPSDHFVVDHSVFINVDGGYEHPLYGSQALAIALHDKRSKSLIKNTSS